MFRRHPVLATLGGLALGLLAAALFGLLVHYGVQSWISSGTWGRTERTGEQFDLWYPDRSPAIAGAADVRAELKAVAEEILARAGIDENQLPDSFDVFLHAGDEELLESLANRKADTTALIGPSLDLLLGEDVRLPMAELLLSHGLGRCTSQLIYLGSVLAIAYPDRNFHAVVAALPDAVRPTLQDLVALEAHGLSETFYQQNTSPTANRYLFSLESVGTVLRAAEAWHTSPLETIEALQAASLVQYLIEKDGSSEILHRVWGAGYTETVLERVSGRSLKELSEAWHEVAISSGQRASDYPYQQALRLAETGYCDEARDVTASWDVESLSESEAVLAVRVNLLSGRFDEAREVAEVCRVSEVCGLSRWIGASVEASDLVRLLQLTGAPASPNLDRLGDVVRRTQMLLGVASDAIPFPVTAVCHGSEEGAIEGAWMVRTSGLSCPIAWCQPTDRVDETLATSVAGAALGRSRSALLRMGVAGCAVSSRDALVAEAMALREEGAWVPLGSIDPVMGGDDRVTRIEASIMACYLAEVHGSDRLAEVWRTTTAIGGATSLDTALSRAVGATRRVIEPKLVAWLEREAARR